MRCVSVISHFIGVLLVYCLMSVRGSDSYIGSSSKLDNCLAKQYYSHTVWVHEFPIIYFFFALSLSRSLVRSFLFSDKKWWIKIPQINLYVGLYARMLTSKSQSARPEQLVAAVVVEDFDVRFGRKIFKINWVENGLYFVGALFLFNLFRTINMYTNAFNIYYNGISSVFVGISFEAVCKA